MNDRPGTHPEPDPPQPPHVPTPNALPLDRGEATGGGMTEESGVLTPEDEPDAFVPAERREIESPGHVGQAALKRHPAARGEGGMGPGSAGSLSGPLAAERASGLTGQMADGGMGGSTTPAAGTQAGSGRSELGSYEGGYGAPQGESPTDPAYRRESHIPDDLPSETPARTEQPHDLRRDNEEGD
jgi:hypothetical protein